MTQLLVSVRSVDEALLALEAGAHLIDIKEPRRGALGPADEPTMRAILTALAGRVSTSAALGEWDCVQPLPGSLEGALTFAKVGLAGAARASNWPQLWRHVLSGLPAGIQSVAVIYADWRAAQSPEPEAVLAEASSAECRAVLIDTFDKQGGSLRDHLCSRQIADLIVEARSRNLITVLAGSLRPSDFAPLLALGPDYLGVRGAACESGRRSALCPRRVRELLRLVQDHALA